MPHESCVTIRGQLTYDEEAQITDWIIRSLKERPKEWVQTNWTLVDTRTKIEVWTSSGREFVSLWQPVRTTNFHKKHQKRLWRAVHEHRHAGGGEAYNAIRAAMADAPLALTGEVIPPKKGLLSRLLPWRREFPMPAALPAPSAVPAE